ncbi:MAG: hypothetical protein JW700_00900 [Candidatus Aenigmarchaeota archaeon]|nr:hypothetical protein [Candidatus Aenigmarchaeota archaeon]
MRGRSILFWIVTAAFIAAWVLSGTLSLLYVYTKNVFVSEFIILFSSLALILIYYVVEPYMD